MLVAIENLEIIDNGLFSLFIGLKHFISEDF